MKILAIGQVEDSVNIELQLDKQTIQPDFTYLYKDPNPAQTIELRRKRIAENHTELRAFVEDYKPDLVFQVEQDCILPENALERLIGHYLRLDDKDFGYVSGIQVGRHGLYCLGAWKNFTDNSFESLDYNLTGVQEVEATGFYCLLAPTYVWLKGKACWHDEPYGPDVNFGLSLTEIGYKIYVDMGLHIGHKVKRGIIEPSHISTCNVKFEKINDKWKYKQL